VTAAFTAQTFRPHIGEQFRVTLESGQELDLELVEVTAVSAGGAGLRPPFSILFAGQRPPEPGRCHSFHPARLFLKSRPQPQSVR
jgi:hypothetical protein